MNTFEVIRTRRSTRKYKAEPIDRGSLEKILQAGRMAPSGGNSQSTHFIVIEKREVLDKLAELAREEFAQMEIGPDTYKSIQHSIRASRAGEYVFHYNAPTLIVTANQEHYGNNIADCACAIENMMLMANELNLGSCWINQLHWLADHDRIRDYMRELGMAEDETVCAAMIVGYPDTEDGLPARHEMQITGNPVTYVE